jgi:DNA-binding beta-propeller fold protein YncE
MRTSIPLNSRPLFRAFYAFLTAFAALWAMPRNACAQLYVAQTNANIVSEYDAKTGAVINANFIMGLNAPTAVAVKGNTLFVANFFGDTVGKYDATTGAAISPSFITGLNVPFGLALLGNTLFVGNAGDNSVGTYDATTGAAINASFITGLSEPFGLAVKSAK